MLSVRSTQQLKECEECHAATRLSTTACSHRLLGVIDGRMHLSVLSGQEDFADMRSSTCCRRPILTSRKRPERTDSASENGREMGGSLGDQQRDLGWISTAGWAASLLFVCDLVLRSSTAKAFGKVEYLVEMECIKPLAAHPGNQEEIESDSGYRCMLGQPFGAVVNNSVSDRVGVGLA